MHKEVVGRKRLIASAVAQMEISCVIAVQELSGQSFAVRSRASALVARHYRLVRR